jgi:phospholipase C
MIGPDGAETVHAPSCFEHETLADLLDRPRSHPGTPISWRYYAADANFIWTAPSAIEHLCQPEASPPHCSAPDWTGGQVVIWPPQILVDINKRALPAVTWITPTGQDSDHANGNTGTGPSWVASIVNAIGESAYWKDTAIFITWDDWGGWYDHVPPPIGPVYGYYELGFRVPLLVVSPYTPKGYVSSTQHDFGSILRFVEKVFDLGLIPPGNFADARADDLMDFFDFASAPRSFTPIPTKIPASRFLKHSRPMELPDND